MELVPNAAKLAGFWDDFKLGMMINVMQILILCLQGKP
jgi:hypothetical protein